MDRGTDLITTPAGFYFDEKNHRYYLNGRRIPGITELLKTGGYVEDRFYTESGKSRGHAIHAACHLLDQKDLDWGSVTDDGVPYVMGYEQFLKDTNAQIDHEFSEKPLCNVPLLFGGTPDRRMRVGPRKWIVDIKTGQVAPWVALQTAGQELLMPDGGPFERYALQLKPDGKYKLWAFKSPKDVPLFRSLVAHYWNKVEMGIIGENDERNDISREESANDN